MSECLRLWPTWRVSSWEGQAGRVTASLRKERGPVRPSVRPCGRKDLPTSEGCLDFSACQHPLSPAFFQSLFLPPTTTCFLQETPVPQPPSSSKKAPQTQTSPKMSPFGTCGGFLVSYVWESPAAWGTPLSPSIPRQRTRGGKLPLGFPPGTPHIHPCMFSSGSMQPSPSGRGIRDPGRSGLAESRERKAICPPKESQGRQRLLRPSKAVEFCALLWVVSIPITCGNSRRGSLANPPPLVCCITPSDMPASGALTGGGL